MTLDASSLRLNPQLAALDLLVHATETAIVALCAAHPAIQYALRHNPEPPIEHLADHVVEQALATLNALDRYRVLLDDLQRLDTGSLDDDDDDDNFTF
jgi:hypothetical protein